MEVEAEVAGSLRRGGIFASAPDLRPRAGRLEACTVQIEFFTPF